LDEEAAAADQFYETVTQSSLSGHRYSPSERQEIDSLMAQREWVLKRQAQVEAALAAIQRDGAVIKKHCSATPEEIQVAIRAYQKRHHDAQCLVLGMEAAQGAHGWRLKEAKASLRRLSVRGRRLPTD